MAIGNPFSSIAAKWRKFYLNYSMVTALYMMEPAERVVINTIVIIMLTTMLYSSWVYLPHYTLKTLAFMGIISPEGIILDDEEELAVAAEEPHVEL